MASALECARGGVGGESARLTCEFLRHTQSRRPRLLSSSNSNSHNNEGSGVSRGNKTPSTPAPPAAQGHLGRERQERARVPQKSLAPALAPARKKVYAGAHRVADGPSGRGEQEGARARGGESARVRGCHLLASLGRTTPPHKLAHTSQTHQPLSLPRTRPRERRLRLPLLAELRESHRPPSSARPSLCAGSAGAREAGARAHSPSHHCGARARAGV